MSNKTIIISSISSVMVALISNLDHLTLHKGILLVMVVVIFDILLQKPLLPQKKRKWISLKSAKKLWKRIDAAGNAFFK